MTKREFQYISCIAVSLIFGGAASVQSQNTAEKIALSSRSIVLEWRNEGVDNDDQWPSRALNDVITILCHRGFAVYLSQDTVRAAMARTTKNAFTNALLVHLLAAPPGSPVDKTAIQLIFKNNKQGPDDLKDYPPWGTICMTDEVFLGISPQMSSPVLNVRGQWTTRNYTLSSSLGTFPMTIPGADFKVLVTDKTGALADTIVKSEWPQSTFNVDMVIRPAINDLQGFVGRLQPPKTN
jgi:hypothetical protein